MTLRLGIPPKGRLMDKTADWFADRGLALRRTGSDATSAAHLRASIARSGATSRLVTADMVQPSISPSASSRR